MVSKTQSKLNPQEAKLRDRVALHCSAGDEVEKAYIIVDDDVYMERFDYEEVTVQRVGSRLRKRYRIVSIPCITYGYNRGDIVAVDGKKVITKLLTDDGQYGYRILYPNFSSDAEAHAHIDPVLETIESEGFETEEYNHLISAVNARNEHDAQNVMVLLQRLIEEGKIRNYDTTR